MELKWKASQNLTFLLIEMQLTGTCYVQEGEVRQQEIRSDSDLIRDGKD